MRADTDVCRLLESDAELDALLRDGVPADVTEHARGCRACDARLAVLETLRTGMTALRDATEASASGFDIADQVMAQLSPVAEARPAGRPAAPWWRRPLMMPAAIAAVAACALFFVLRSGDATSAMRLDAPDGATISTSAGDRQVQGSRIDVPSPAVIRTAAGQVASLRAGDQIAEVWSDSALHIGADDSWFVDIGAVTFTTPREILVRTRGGEIRGRGHFAVERNTDPPAEKPMRILTKNRVAATSAVIALAVFAGWATLSSGSSETEIKAPGGAFTDGKGGAYRFGLAGSGATVAATGSTSPGAGADGQPGADGEGEGAENVGAFWDDDKQMISFAVPGEVLDADTGEPITEFRITARAIESQGYAQSGETQRPFSGATDGKFVLPGLGLGVWRLTIAAEGYAPLATTVDLTEVDADPYVVAPLWEGGQLSGRVVDWRGRPVEGAKIGMSECFDRKEDKTCGLAESKADGTFSLPGLPHDQVFSISAAHPRYGFANENNIRRAPDSSEHVVIELSGIVRIHGEVSAGKEREAVVGAVVTDGKDARTNTDHNGVYEMLVPLQSRPESFVETLSGGKVIGRAASYPDSRSAWQLEWVEASTHVAEVRIDFRLAVENATLFGQVTDEKGQPLADLDLDVRNSSGWAPRDHETFPTYARTDAQGRYRIDNVPAHAGYDIRYKAQGADSSTRLGYVNVEDETEVEANFTIGSGTIRGRFVDSKTGEQVGLGRGCDRLGARREGQAGYALVTCYGDGRFEIEDLAPGTYTLHNRVEWMASPVVIESREVVVAAGAIVEDVEVKIEGEPSIQWKFRILNDKDKFVLGAYSRIHAGNTSFTSSLDVQADGTATDTINRKYKSIFIDAPGYESSEIDLSSRDPDKVIEVRLQRQ